MEFEKKIQRVLDSTAFMMNIDLYFWMIDRGDFEDDQRNQVDVQKQRVKLYREHGHNLENGYYIGKLMHQIRKTIIKKSKKPFTLDPSLNNLKDQTTQAAKQFNWSLIISELKKFNIKYNKDQKDAIIKDTKHALIIDVLQKLQLYDQNLMALDLRGSQQITDPYDGLKRRKSPPDNNSEINYGMNNIERKNQYHEIESHVGQNYGNGHVTDDQRSDISNLQSISQIGSKPNKLLSGAPQKKQLLDPIIQEKTQNEFEQYFDVGANDPMPLKQEKPLIQLHQMQMVNDDLEQSINFDTNDHTNHLDIDDHFQPPPPQQQSDIKNDEVNDADTAVLYIFATLKQAFGLRHNQVGGLLADKNKYLVQTCVKGMKGADFTKVLKWYNIIYNSVGRLIYLLTNELDQVFSTLNVLKSGLFSKDPDVCNLCCMVFTKIVTIVYENSQNSAMGEVKHQMWEWLTIHRAAQKQPRAIQSPKKNLELESFQNEAGLKAFLRAQVRHPTEFIDQFSLFLIQVGEDNQIELFTHHLRLSCANNLIYLELIQSLYEVMIKTPNGKSAFIDSGVLSVLMDMMMQYAGISSFVDTGLTPASQQFLSERSVSLVFIVDVWKYKTDFVQNQQNESRMPDAIISVLKKGCRDRSKVISVLSINLLANLLESFARERNKFAPVIFKALTFILIDLYLNTDLREEMLHNFIHLFRTQPSIPIQILCEPLFKQIQINLEKKEFIESNQNILQPQSDMFNLNNTDFLFFMNIAIHPKLNANIAIQLLSIVSEISRKNLIFTRISLKLLLTILNRFENNTQVFEFCQIELKKNFNTIMKQDQQKVELYKILMKNPKTKIAAKKRSAQLALSINNSLDNSDFNHLASKNTQNVKYKKQSLNDNPGSSLDKTKGIVSGGGGIGNVEFLDDSDLQNTLNPNIHQDESSQYLKMRTTEKMIVNQLQCFINTGIKVLVDFIRDQLLETYIKIEKKYKFKNKGVLYLLQLFNQDVTKMLQFYYNEQTKARAEQIRLKKLQREQDLAMTRDHTEEDEVYPLNHSRDPYSALGYYQDSINERDAANSIFTETPGVSLTVKKSAPKAKSSMKHSNLMIQPRVYDSVDYSSSKKKINNTVDPDYNYDNYYDSPKRIRQLSIGSTEIGPKNLYKRSLGDHVPVRALEIGRAKMGEQIKLYDPADYEGEAQKYVSWVRQYLKLYKAMFHRYSTVSKNKSGLRKNTFDDMQSNKSFMNLYEIFTFLNDFQIPQNYPEIKREDIKNLIKYTNLKRSNVARGATEIDLEGFIELILQIGYIISDRIDKASIFMPRLFRYMKEVSFNADQPLFQRLFEDPNASSIGDPALIRELTRKVNMDPNYKLPPGFVKYPMEQMVQSFKPPDFFPESHQIALMVLDDIYMDIFGDHYLYPDVNYQQKWGVKPDVFQKQIKSRLKPQYMKIDKKHQYQGRNGSVDPLQTEMDAYEQKSMSNRKYSEVRFSSQPRSGASPLKSKSIRKKPTMIMESTLEPDLDIALKIQLAENILHPNRMYLKEAATVLNDMLGAIDDGKTSLSPRTRSRYYNVSNIGVNGGTSHRVIKPIMNKVMIDKEKAMIEDTLRMQEKERKLWLHQAKIKKELEFYQSQKQIKLIEEAKREKALAQQRANEKARNELEKKQFYDQLKVEFVETRLPDLQATSKVDAELKAAARQKQRMDKEIAKQQIEKNAKELSQKFNEQARKREEQEFKKRREEEIARQKADQKNSRLANQFKQKQGIRQSQTMLPRNQSVSHLRSSQSPAGGVSPQSRQKTQLYADPIKQSSKSAMKQSQSSTKKPPMSTPGKSVQQLPQIKSSLNVSTQGVPTQKQLDKMSIDEKQRRINELKKSMNSQRQASVQPSAKQQQLMPNLSNQQRR